MYATAFNRVSDMDEVRRMVATVGAAELITIGSDGYPQATLLPIIWSGAVVTTHMARPNPHWTQIADNAPALLVCSGPQAYISPSWYSSKREHGKVVPTWNYTSVHLRGAATVHDDPEWLRSQVTALTGLHEHDRHEPWHVTDAPSRFVEGQLRGIVGIEIRVERVEGKAKLSQNRSAEDQRGVIDGLGGEADQGAAGVADAMRAGLANGG
jgi:transcriptional regulator